MTESEPSGIYESSDVQWFVVCGAPRSGTTMLTRVLNTHPRVGCFNEVDLGRFFSNVTPLFDRGSDDSDRLAWTASQRSSLFDLSSPEGETVEESLSIKGKLKAADLHGRKRDSLLAERGLYGHHGNLNAKTHGLPVIRSLFEIGLGKTALSRFGSKIPNLDPVATAIALSDRLPNLRLIQIIRRPIDVVNSSLGRRAYARAGADIWHIETVEDACNEWRVSWTSAVSAYKQLGDRILFVKYEDLIARSQDSNQQIADHLGVSPEFDLTICSPLPASLAGYAYEPGEEDVARSILGVIDDLWDRPLDALLKDHPVVAFPLPDDGIIRFTTDGNGHLYTRGGFADPEEWGRWTDGAIASLDVDLARRSGDVFLTIDCTIWRRDHRIACPIVLSAGRWRDIVTIPAGDVWEFFKVQVIIPRIALAENIGLALRLHVPEPKSSLDEPRSEQRKLGLGLRAMAFKFID